VEREGQGSQETGDADDQAEEKKAMNDRVAATFSVMLCMLLVSCGAVLVDWIVTVEALKVVAFAGFFTSGLLLTLTLLEVDRVNRVIQKYPMAGLFLGVFGTLCLLTLIVVMLGSGE